MNGYNYLLEILSGGVKEIVMSLQKEQLDKLEEIRLRTGCPLAATRRDGGVYMRTPYQKNTKNLENQNSQWSPFTNEWREAYIVTQRDLMETLALISGYSIYAFEEEIKKGFITIKGGHRVGVCGKAVIENGDLKTLKNISSLNIRFARQIKGCAKEVMKHIIKNKTVKHTIIVSPPRGGKTTMLRDIVRLISDGIPQMNFEGTNVSVVDERSEIAGTYMGAAQNDVGKRTDILDCCPKAIGMQMLLRGMSPSVVAVDEIGGKDDVYAIEEMLNAGIKVICTVHGNGLSDIRKKPHLKELIERELFETIIVLSGNGFAGKIECVYDKGRKKGE